MLDVFRKQEIKTELDKILRDFLPLTYSKNTSKCAHNLLTAVIIVQCELVKTTDYGIVATDEMIAKLKISK
jgi:hypothetical protein